MTTYSNGPESALTVDSLLKTVEQFQKKFTIWYGTHDGLTPGKFICYKATEYSPAFFVCHPDDLDTLRTATPGWTWRHLREHQP